MVEVPADDPIEFPLPVLTALDGGTSHVDRCVSIQPLLTKHRKESGEQRSSETGEQDCLDLDNRVWWTSPRLWEGGSVVAVGGIVHLIDEEAEESGGLFVRIGLELGVDLDDKGGSDGGEQTSLRRESTHVYLDDVYNIRISGSHPSRPYISSEIPYRTPPPPCRSIRRILCEDLAVTPAPLSFCARVSTALQRDTR